MIPDLSDSSAVDVARRTNVEKRPSDVAIVSVHWGSNWGYDVDSRQIRFAHKLIDEGIDVVHGHSSHHPRPIEVYRGKLILYGCGDTIDDYEGIGTYESFRHELRLLYFASIECETGNLSALQMVPMRMRRMRLEGVPDDDAEWLRSTVEQISSRFGTRVNTTADGVLTAMACRGWGRLGEGELGVQLGQPPQDEGRDVLVVAVMGRAVLVLGDPDVRRAIEEPLNTYPCFDPGE